MKPCFLHPSKFPMGFPIRIQPRALWDVYLSRSDPWPCPDLGENFMMWRGYFIFEEQKLWENQLSCDFEDSCNVVIQIRRDDNESMSIVNIGPVPGRWFKSNNSYQGFPSRMLRKTNGSLLQVTATLKIFLQDLAKNSCCWIHPPELKSSPHWKRRRTKLTKLNFIISKYINFQSPFAVSSRVPGISNESFQNSLTQKKGANHTKLLF